MAKKAIDQIQEIKKIQTNFISQIRKANEVVPIVEKELEWTNYIENSLETAPAAIKSLIENNEVSSSFSLIEDSLKEVLPALVIDTRMASGTVTGANATLSAVVFNAINGGGAIGSNNNSTNTSWVNNFNQGYNALQIKQNVVNEIATKLEKISLKDEFLRAVEKYLKTNSRIASTEDAAIIMRNVMEGLQGNLFELVRNNSRILQSQKSVKWEHISNILSIGGEGSSQSKLLLEKREVYVDIKDNLTLIAKNSVQNPIELLNSTYPKWLDFLHTTLSLIDSRYIS